MLVRELASKKELLRSGRIEHRGKRKSHGFGRERGLLEVPEKTIFQRRIRHNIRKTMEKTEIESLEEILAKLTKKERMQMSDEIKRGVENFVARTSLMYTQDLRAFAKVVEASKKHKNRELRKALEVWKLELRILKERDIEGKNYFLRYRKKYDGAENSEEVEEKNVKYIVESIVKRAEDEKITSKKIRIPTEGSLILDGKEKRVTITLTEITEDAWEVLEVKIEEKN
jgi:hypothetical protein